MPRIETEGITIVIGYRDFKLFHYNENNQVMDSYMQQLWWCEIIPCHQSEENIYKVHYMTDKDTKMTTCEDVIAQNVWHRRLGHQNQRIIIKCPAGQNTELIVSQDSNDKNFVCVLILEAPKRKGRVE